MILRSENTVSTNTDAIELANNGADSGTVVVSNSQTGGVGRFGRKWFSPNGAGLYVSVLIRPVINTELLGYLSFCAVNAAHSAVLHTTGISLNSKWPNDLILRTKKVGGILSYCRTGIKNIPEFTVIGLGLNIKKTAYPSELIDIASCLEEAGVSPEPERLLEQYLSSLEYEINDLQSNGNVYVRERLLKHMNTLGKKVKVSEKGNITTGIAVDIEKSGALNIIDGEGNRHAFYSGDVTIVR